MIQQKKDKCYSMGCEPVETGINTLRIYVCRSCKYELTEKCYKEETARIKRNEEIAKKDKEKKSGTTVAEKTPDPIQEEFDAYLGNLGIDNTFKDWPV